MENAMDSKIGLLAAVIALALVGCGDDKGMARWTESTPAQVNAFGRMVSLLEEAQCLPPEVAGKLRPLEGTSLRLISSLSKADQESICDGGRELLESVQSAQTLPLFEGEEIAFDADGDGCIESLFNLNELAVATYDANSDGCFDRIWDFENALNDLAVDDSVKGELAEKARLVIAHMLPPTAEQMPDSGTPFDWPEYRAQAEVRLDELLLAIDGAAMGKETREVLASFAENTRHVVVNHVGYTPPQHPLAQDPITVTVPGPAGGKEDGIYRYNGAPPSSTTDDRWLCLYVMADQAHEAGPPFGHVFVGLVQGQDVFIRGLTLRSKVPGENPGIPSVPFAESVTGDGSAMAEANDNRIYPKIPQTDDISMGPGIIADDSKYAWDARVCWKISSEQWHAVATYMNTAIKDPPYYSLLGGIGMNCIAWAKAVLEQAGIAFSDFTYSGGLSTPTSVLQRIFKMNAEAGEYNITIHGETSLSCGNGLVEAWLGESCDLGLSIDCALWQHQPGGGWQHVEGSCTTQCRCSVSSPYPNTAAEQKTIGCLLQSDCPEEAPQCYAWFCMPVDWVPSKPGVYSSSTGRCTLAPVGSIYLPDASLACEDGDPCTLDDTCTNGICSSKAACGNGEVQTDCAEACDPPGANCQVAGADGKCTDACACQATHPDWGDQTFVGCQTVDDCPPMTLPECWYVWCDEESHICVGEPSKGGDDCDDKDPCTYDDMCDGQGKCTGLKLPCDDGNPCTIDSCDPATGECQHEMDKELDVDEDGHCNWLDNCPFVANDQTDTDGDFIGDACECEYASCPAEATQCQLACNPETGECPFKPDFSNCDDGVLCTENDVCIKGTCTGGKIDEVASCCTKDEDCNDHNICTDDFCEKGPGKCINMNLGALSPKPIDDGDPCTVDEACHEGVLVPGSIITCTSDNNPCTLDTCQKNPETGEADCHLPLPKGHPCEDGDGCTVGDFCDHKPAPVCVSGTKLACDDSVFCTLDTCESGECQHLPQEGCCQSDGDCDDGDDCTENACDTDQSLCYIASMVCESACCDDDGECWLKSPLECQEMGGISLKKTTCEWPEVSCTQGACCNLDGSCDYVGLGACKTGNFHQGETCDEAQCNWSCCLEDGTCHKSTSFECSQLNPKFAMAMGLNDKMATQCDELNCGWACCVGGECIDTTQEDCGQKGGHYSPNVKCESIGDGCFGACCYDKGKCVDAPPAACEAAGGTPFPQLQCAEGTCPMGACCTLWGNCYETVGSLCKLPSVYHIGQKCTDDLCGEPCEDDDGCGDALEGTVGQCNQVTGKCDITESYAMTGHKNMLRPVCDYKSMCNQSAVFELGHVIGLDDIELLTIPTFGAYLVLPIVFPEMQQGPGMQGSATMSLFSDDPFMPGETVYVAGFDVADDPEGEDVVNYQMEFPLESVVEGWYKTTLEPLDANLTNVIIIPDALPDCGDGLCPPISVGLAFECDAEDVCGTCDDADPCTIDACDPLSGCIYEPISLCCVLDEQCNDGDACTIDFCDEDNHTCKHTALDCDDGNECTEDSCLPESGCHYAEVTCVSMDNCVEAWCDKQLGCQEAPIVCNDNNPCTTDSCDPDTGCVFEPVSCDDSKVCTTDGCDIAIGCFNTPIEGCCDPNDLGACDDGQTCQCSPDNGCTCVAKGKPCTLAGNPLTCLSAFVVMNLPVQDNKVLVGFEGSGDVELMLMLESASGPGGIVGVETYHHQGDLCTTPVVTEFANDLMMWTTTATFQAPEGQPLVIELELDPNIVNPPGSQTVMLNVMAVNCF
jgi:hypothetical protein